ncbi:flavin reductase family protein [Alphaproteobacteria bacterium KMM 3653]|uniref:Flavin reductase family protein n=1 Tax=Harenicola maris TaxID=2841044 RepID=A0AAP2CNR1_9RHOB|nr:flavin reductase family protein [Harenicola maris]
MTQPGAFVPSPETQRDFRDCLGCFGTGVCVVTTQTPEGPLAMTANSFAAVSLDPPLVLWSPAVTSARHDPFAKAAFSAVHIMDASQGDLATRFARDGRDFDHADWDPDENGTPQLHGTLARFDCAAHAAHPAGDHTILVLRVLAAQHRAGSPLLFVQGQYGHFVSA